MRLRRVPLETIVEAYIYSCKAGIPIDIKTLEVHCLAGGNVLEIIKGYQDKKLRELLEDLKKP